jgi:hypothetical protein
MQNDHPHLVTLASALLATFFLVSCQQSQPPTSGPPEPRRATPEIFVTFEGPWAIVADPKNANSVLAIAPKTKSHAPLGVVPANIHLDAGVYELSIPAASAGAPSFDKNLFKADVVPEAIQRALDSKGRYVIRLPKPEAYVAETRSASRVSSTYPPDASTEQEYASAVSLRYSVSSKTGFQLTGTQDAGGAFKPLLFELSVPAMRFTIDPIEAPLQDEPCHTHAREAFHDVAQLVGLKLYVDFPGSPADCRKKDPQVARAQKAQLLPDLPLKSIVPFSVVPLSVEDPGLTQQAGMTGGGFAVLEIAAQKMMVALGAAFYLFHSEGGACMAPIIVDKALQ